MKKAIILLVAMALVSVMAGGVALAAGARVQVSALHCDAYGNDYHNLNGEYVVLKNTSGARINMGGWKVHDRGTKHTYIVSRGFRIAPWSKVTLHTGQGRNTATNLYWGLRAPVWNNDGDTATLLDNLGRFLSQRSC